MVDDDQAYVDAYATWLEDDYNVMIAHGGNEALTQLDNDLDVVLLDRRMPDLNGDLVLKEIRNRNIDCRVALVTAVEPKLNIIELEFDEYLLKPVSQQELEQLIEQLLIRNRFSESVQRGFQLTSTKSTLESTYSAEELEQNDKYEGLIDELSEVENDIGHSINELIESDQVVAAYQDLEKHPLE